MAASLGTANESTMHSTVQGKRLGYDSGASLMAEGPHALYSRTGEALASGLEHGLPQVEIRFRHLSVEAHVQVDSDGDNGDRLVELPTLVNDVKRKVAKLTATKSQVRKQILRDVSGVFRPGTMTLVLGQPGSGKSSLMKMLSGRFPMSSDILVDGEISYNGKTQSEIIQRLPQVVSYVPQHDQHLSLLTVNETLEIANNVCRPEVDRRRDELLRAGGDASKLFGALVAHYPDVMVQQVGLQQCQNTVIGDEMLRGISGGERKRVTLGEMEFGLRAASFMDEISTGLDSSTTFDIVRTQRSIADSLRKTIVISLLQPSPEVFALFDDVLLLNAGEVMYLGPVTQVEQYFAGLGFNCPADRDVADFLLELGTPQQTQYRNNTVISVPRSPSEFADKFRASQLYHETLRAVDAQVAPELVDLAKVYIDRSPKFGRPLIVNTWILARRQLLLIMRNTAYLKSRATMLVIMGLVFGSLFWQVDPENAQVTFGVAYQASLFLVLSQGAQVTAHMNCRGVFYKHRRANFYQTLAYVVASSASLFPLALIESIFFGTIVYWMCGFVAEAGPFVVFLLLFFLSNLGYAAWFFFLAAAAPDLHLAHSTSMVADMFFTLFAGFVIVKSQIPNWLIWIYWLDPLTWSFRALAVNQFRSATLDVCDYNGQNYCSDHGMTMGEYSLSLYDIESGREWIWFGVLYSIGVYIFFMTIGYFVLEYKRYETPEAISVDLSTVNASDRKDDGNYAAMETPRANADESKPIEVEVQYDRPAVTPVSLAFQDLWYSVPKPGNTKESLDLLKNVSGYALPGTMTALMGSSGAGKTTLLDVIAGRKTAGTIQGRILLNGCDADALSIQRCTGYCEQMDIHSDASTIREALVFSAFLRQDSTVPSEHKFAAVEECLDMLELRSIADQIVRGCSAEQLKRLTIGVELAAHPSVLFLDEPTSGLDARTAKIIMDGVRRVADSGRTVLCTIHQPSAEIFSLFDSLLLLKRGGETVFFGDLGIECKHLVEYFEAIDGIASLPNGYNPATWMLECIGAGVDTTSIVDIDFVDHFGKSAQKTALDDQLSREGVGFCSPGSAEISFGRKRAASSMTQMTMLMRRFFDLYWRTPSYNLSRFAIAICLGLVFGVLYVDVEYETYQGVNAGVGVLFIACLFNGMIPFRSVRPIASLQRAAYYRERASQTYSTFWYFVADSVVEIPYAVMSSLMFTVIFFPLLGFSGFATGVLYWINNTLLILTQVYYGQFFVYVFPSLEVADSIGVLSISIFLMFMGFNPPANAIPAGYKWLYHISPQKYTIGVFAALVFADCSDDPVYDAASGEFSDVGSSLGCQPLRNAPSPYEHLTVKQYVEQVFLTKYDDLAFNFGMQIAFITLFLLLKLLALRFVNHQKR